MRGGCSRYRLLVALELLRHPPRINPEQNGGRPPTALPLHVEHWGVPGEHHRSEGVPEPLRRPVPNTSGSQNALPAPSDSHGVPRPSFTPREDARLRIEGLRQPPKALAGPPGSREWLPASNRSYPRQLDVAAKQLGFDESWLGRSCPCCTCAARPPSRVKDPSHPTEGRRLHQPSCPFESPVR